MSGPNYCAVCGVDFGIVGGGGGEGDCNGRRRRFLHSIWKANRSSPWDQGSP